MNKMWYLPLWHLQIGVGQVRDETNHSNNNNN